MFCTAFEIQLVTLISYTGVSGLSLSYLASEAASPWCAPVKAAHDTLSTDSYLGELDCIAASWLLLPPHLSGHLEGEPVDRRSLCISISLLSNEINGNKFKKIFKGNYSQSLLVIITIVYHRISSFFNCFQ